MFRKCLFLVTVVLMAATIVFAQGTFKPRDADEEHAWRLYNQYKESRRIETPLEAQIKGKFNDALMAAHGIMAGKGVDSSDVAELTALREKQDTERARQTALLAAWEKKFYWRYGDLRWSGETIYDAKAKRQMDRIEFALTYFRFNYKKDAATGGANAAPGQSGQSGATFTAEKGAADSWSHIRVTVGNVTNFKTEDRPGWRNNGTGFTAVSADSGPVKIKIDIIGKGGVSYFDYISSVSVKTSDGKILIAEQPVISKDGGNKSYSVVWDPAAKPGGVSIEIKIMGGNPEHFSYFVSGSLAAGKSVSTVQTVPTNTAANTKPLVDLTGTWSCSDGGTYRIKQSGTSITWEGASVDGGRTWSHTFTGTIEGDKIVGRFNDHPPGRYTNRGELKLRIVGGSKLEYFSSSVPFGGRVWTR